MLPPGATIGILGVGQLGRMLCAAAGQLGFKTSVYGPDAESAPAAQLAGRAISGAYDDEAAIGAFAAGCDVVTYEFENVPAEAAHAAAEVGRALAPNAKALRAAQERLTEKELFRKLGIPTVSFWPIADAAELEAALAKAGPSILKTRRFGYDGKGQVRLQGHEDPAAVLAELGGGPWILEALAPFSRELSLIAARSASGEVACFDLCDNQHKDGILARSVIPADVQGAAVQQAEAAAKALLSALDYVGVLTTEFFEVDGKLLANEMAPRVHNSGHHTLEACSVSQFEQHIRAIAGWPLRTPRTLRPMEMRNLIGKDAEEWSAFGAMPDAHVTLYGKSEARPGRKMGHLVRPLGEKESRATAGARDPGTDGRGLSVG